MLRRLRLGLFFIVLLLAISAGYPYATLVINRWAGTHTVVLTERDGTTKSLTMGPSAPLPGWVPDLPRSIILNATYWHPTPDRPLSGSLELLTHKDVADLKHFYLEALKSAGFDIRDVGFGMMNAPLAALYGFEGQLHGYRASDQLEVHVTIHEATGLLRPRYVDLHWGRSAVDATSDPDKPFAPWKR